MNELMFIQLWQVTLVGVVVLLITRLFAKNRPHLAHVLWVLVLLKCVTPPVFSSPVSLFSWLTSPSSVVSTDEATETFPVFQQQELSVAISEPSQVYNFEDASFLGVTSEAKTETLVELAPAEPQRPPIQISWSRIALAIWLIGSLVSFTVIATRFIFFVRWVRRSQTVDHPHVNRLVAHLTKQLGIRRKVRIRILAANVGPAVIGLFRPTILLPAAIVESKTQQQLEPLVAHELVHVRRGDLWWALIQTIGLSIFWFHPLVVLAARMVSRESERSCDEETIASLNLDPSKYASALLDVLEQKNLLRIASALPGVKPVDITSARLERVMKLGNGSHKRTPVWVWMVLLISGVTVLPGAAWVWGQESTDLKLATPLPATHSEKVKLAQEPAPANQQQKQTETLAVVNSQPISRNQIANKCMRRFGKDVLESMVNKLLVLRQCQASGIVITEKDVDDEIAIKAKKFGMSGERYVQTICSRRSISVDRLKNDIIWHELALRHLADKNLNVSPTEIANRMESEFGERVQVRQIVVDSFAQAQKIRQQAVANPEEFERLAKSLSLDKNSNSLGGLLPPIRRNLQSPEYEELAFGLQPGQVSLVFPIAGKFIILRCEQFFPAETLTQEQTALAHERFIDEIKHKKLAESARLMFQKMQETTKVVNVMNDPQLSPQYPGVAAMVDNVKILKNQVGEECITRFGAEILDSEINRTLLTQALKQKGIKVGEQDLNVEIARVAESVGHLNKNGTVNIDQWLALVTNNDASKEEFYIEDEVWPTVALKKLVAPTVSVTQEDMNKGFEANYGPRVEVKAIVAREHRNALKVWNMASANPNADYFGQLASQYSIEPASKNRHGNVPPIQMYGGRPELEKEAFKLQVGEISPLVQVGEHWVILYCLGRTESVVADFDAVKEELHNMILEKKLRTAMGIEFERLRKDSQIDNFLTGTS